MARRKATKDNGPDMARFAPHPQRAAALGEIHSRPSPAISAPRVILHFAFSSDGGSSPSHAVLAELCRTRGLSAPDPMSRYHELAWGRGHLRWERHSEFTTFSFDGPAPAAFQGEVVNHPFGPGFNQPGMLISATRVEIRHWDDAGEAMLAAFDPESVCVTQMENETTAVATDFRQDANGMTLFLLLSKGVQPARLGYFAKSVIELETYRTLAMLGLPMAQSLSARLSGYETELAHLTSEMRNVETPQVPALLDRMMKLAGESEADATASLFRFGATRAYGEIVHERMAMLGGERMNVHREVMRYLNVRLAPALRTCRSVEDRQIILSEKLHRSATLLRTRLEVDMEQQNRDLLDSMDRRARQQLRLQQTVEGLSVAAISYYVVGLFSYFAFALESWAGPAVSGKLLTALFVPVAILGVWWLVRRIRRFHVGGQ